MVSRHSIEKSYKGHGYTETAVANYVVRCATREKIYDNKQKKPDLALAYFSQNDTYFSISPEKKLTTNIFASFFSIRCSNLEI